MKIDWFFFWHCKCWLLPKYIKLHNMLIKCSVVTPWTPLCVVTHDCVVAWHFLADCQATLNFEVIISIIQKRLHRALHSVRPLLYISNAFIKTTQFKRRSLNGVILMGCSVYVRLSVLSSVTKCTILYCEQTDWQRQLAAPIGAHMCMLSRYVRQPIFI